jgi:hypothetical protein
MRKNRKDVSDKLLSSAHSASYKELDIVRTDDVDVHVLTASQQFSDLGAVQEPSAVCADIGTVG